MRSKFVKSESRNFGIYLEQQPIMKNPLTLIKTACHSNVLVFTLVLGKLCKMIQAEA